MRKFSINIKDKKINHLDKEAFKVNGIYGSAVLEVNPLLATGKKKLIKDKLKGNFDVLQSVNSVSYVNLLAKGIGYKVFTPKVKKFLNTVVVKMGFGGSELGWRAPSFLRVRAKKQKLTLIGLDKAQLRAISNNFRALKYPGAYTGKGLQYKGENILLKKRKAATRSK